MVPFAIGIKKRKSPLIKAERAVRKNLIKIPFHLFAKTRTFRTGAKRVIKAEESRLEVRDRNSAVRAGVFLTEKYFFVLITHTSGNNYNSVCIFQSNFNTVCKAASHLITLYNTVNDNFDSVLFLFIKLYRIFKLSHYTVYTGTNKARSLGII